MTCNVLSRQKVNPHQAGQVIHHGILFTIGMFLREKNQLAKKGLKFSLNYYYKDTPRFFHPAACLLRLSCRLACCQRLAA
jgi:hypothetical protein